MCIRDRTLDLAQALYEKRLLTYPRTDSSYLTDDMGGTDVYKRQEDDSPLALKSDFILSLCELVIGGKEGLQPVDKTVIDRAVRNV